jgi:hypothetical protein
MTSSVFRLLGAILWGCMRGAVGAFAFSYMQIVKEWDPLLLASLFGTCGSLIIVNKRARSNRKENPNE